MNQKIIDKNHQQLFKECFSRFYELEDHIFEILFYLFKVKELNKGEYFARADEECDSIAFVGNGLFKVSILSETGKEYIKYFLKESDPLLANLEPGEVSRVSIMALEPSFIFEADYELFLSCCHQYPELEQLNRFLLRKYWNKKEKRSIDLLANDARVNYRIFKEEYPELERRIPQYQVASYLGITPTQLSRLKN